MILPRTCIKIVKSVKDLNKKTKTKSVCVVVVYPNINEQLM